ncbi:MAG: alpha/beta fold hydrolase [Actinomycetota bacterium]
MTDAARDIDRGEPLRVGEVDLWVDVAGDADDTVVLLAGADTPGFRWAPGFVDALVDADFRVVRFDHRDCGRSSWLGSEAGYLLDDLTNDLIGLLDHLAVEAAHLVGRSMGGMVAQVAALDHPQRVRSLTLLGSTPGAGDERLPGPDDAFIEAMMHRLYAGPPPDRRSLIDWLAELAELLAGEAYSFDAEEAHRLAAAELATGWQPDSGHGVAVHGSPSRLDRLAEIAQPTLVVHGTADPVFPIEHGRALASGIDGAVLVEVDRLGHETPAPMLEELTPVLLAHLRGAAAWPDQP